MTTALLVAAVTLAALACPAMMWWNARRGRRSPRCPPQRSRENHDLTLEDLREEASASRDER
jgi:hypothetical protein